MTRVASRRHFARNGIVRSNPELVEARTGTGTDAHRSYVERWPVYPGLVVAAFLLATYVQSTAPIEALVRPLFVVLLGLAAVQVVASVVLRSSAQGAFLVCLGLLWLLAREAIVPAILVAGAILLVEPIRARRLVPANWPRVTAFFNVAAGLFLGLGLLNAAFAGAMSPVGRDGRYAALRSRAPLTSTSSSSTDILEPTPCVTTTDSITARSSARWRRSASMSPQTPIRTQPDDPDPCVDVNARQVRDIEAFAYPLSDVAAQNRLVTRVINEGSMLAEFRSRGYEIVTAPSPFTNVTLWTADRVLADGGVTEVEISLLRGSPLTDVLPDVERTLLMDSARSRVVDALGATAGLAGTRDGRPKLVLTQLMSPHNPILFGADGSPQYGWPCFPVDCNMWDGGQRYGSETIVPTVGQIEHLNELVLGAVQRILRDSATPPVVLVFSDHGHRHNLEDADEMISSLLLSYTPGAPGLIPNDATPVNLLPRILNAYFGANVALAQEESYTVNLLESLRVGMFTVDMRPQ